MESLHQQQLLSRLITYVPVHGVRRALENPEQPRPSSEWRQGAVLAAELHGLGPLAEHANRLGADGAEELCRLLNLGLAALLEQALFPTGGQLVRLSGEQVLAFFTGDDALACAAQAGLQMHGALARSGPRLSGNPGLSLRVGIAKGPIYLAQIGDAAERMELVVAGPAVSDAFAAAAEARTGEVLAPAVHLESEPHLGTAGMHGEYASVAVVDPAPATRPFPDLSAHLAERTVAKINALRPFVSLEVFDRLLADPAAPPERPKLRRATVLLAEFWSIDPSKASSGEDFNRRFLAAHRVVQRHGGEMVRLDFTGKGRKLAATFGLPEPRGSDEERALGCALELREALGSSRMRAAVDAGFVFFGEVGSALKREHAVLGAPVQTAGRLLAAAEEGAIVAGPEVARAAGAGFELGPVWQVRIPGTRLPVQARTVVRRQDRIRQAVAPGRLAGRTRELAVAQQKLAAMLRQGGGALVVRAEQGAGKTRFLRELVAQAGSARTTFKRLRCSYLTRERPFALVEACIQALTGEARPLAAWLEELPELCESQLAALGEWEAPAGLAGYLALQKRLAVDALRVLGNQPRAVLVLDDLHEADADSLEVFRTLAKTGGLAFLASSAVPLGGELDELLLPPLDSVGLTELTREELGEAPPALVAWLAQRSAGNVLQARSLLAWLLETDALERGPSGFTLRAADLETLPSALKLSAPQKAYPRARPDSGPNIIEGDPARLMTDPGMPPPGADGGALLAERARNRGLAELIEAVPGAAESRSEELALLYGESDRPEQAVRYARAAARSALGRNRFALALSWTEAAARSAQLTDDPALCRAVRFEEAEAWQRLYDPHRAAAIAREVASDARDGGDSGLAFRAELLQALALADGYAPGAEEICHEVLVRAEPGSEAEARARLALARVLRGRGELGEAEVLLERATDLAAGMPDEELRAHTLVETGLLRAERGDSERARSALEAAAELCSAPGLIRARVIVLLNLGVVRAADGDVPGAEEAYREAERLAGELGLVIPRAAALVNLSDLHRDAGDVDLAWEFASRAQLEARRSGDARLAGAAALARALSAGPDVDALAFGAEALRQLEPLEDASLFIEAAARLAHKALDRGERGWAVQLFTAARARADLTGIARHAPALDRLDFLLRSSSAPRRVLTGEDLLITAPGA